MNAKQDNKVGMFGSVALACDKAAKIWASLVAFVAAYDKFKNSLERIKEFAQKQAEASKGATEFKKYCRQSMCEAAQVIAGAVHSHATENNDVELAAKVDVSLSSLLTGRDRVSAEKCQSIHRLASEKVADLAEQGVTAAKLKSLQTKIDDYTACLQRPRQIISEVKTATAQLEAEIETADQLLADGLDRLVLQFKDSEPEFYNNYLNARVIVDNASGHDSGEATPQPKAA